MRKGSPIRQACSSKTLAVIAAFVLFVPLSMAGFGAAQAAADTEEITLRCHAPADQENKTSYQEADEFPSFESSWIPLRDDAGKHICAAHFGHHTFFPGHEQPLLLQGGSGEILLVEQTGLSPADQIPQFSTEDGAALVTEVQLEASLDGVNWEPIATGNHSLVEVTTPEGDLFGWGIETACFNAGIICAQPNNFRQEIHFDIGAHEEPFRFFRVANPESVYTGLTGFLDRSSFDLHVEHVEGEEATTTSGPLELTCQEDIMEATLHSEDPCSFGGYLTEEAVPWMAPVRIGNQPGQWDAPSFFHTYPTEGAILDGVEGEVVVRDYRSNGPSEDQMMLVQTTTDGYLWETIGAFEVTSVQDPLHKTDRRSFTYEGTFNIDLGGDEVDFLRLVAEPRPDLDVYWENSTPWANRHPWAYFVESEITLTGTVPDAGT